MLYDLYLNGFYCFCKSNDLIEAMDILLKVLTSDLLLDLLL